MRCCNSRPSAIWGPIARLCLPGLILLVMPVFDSRRGCAQSQDETAVYKPFLAFDLAVRLHFAARLTEGNVAQALREFDGGEDDGLNLLPATRDVFGKVVEEAEGKLRREWPRTRIEPRMASWSNVVTFIDTSIDARTLAESLSAGMHETRILDADSIRELVSTYPELAKSLPGVETIKIRKAIDTVDYVLDPRMILSADVKVRYVHKKPENDVSTDEALLRETARLAPQTATVWIAYDTARKADGEDHFFPAMVRTVKCEFEFRGECWELIEGQEEEDEEED